jgi:surface antigen
MPRKYVVTALLPLVYLAACQSNPSKQETGVATGAVLGGALGHQVGHGSGNTIANIGGAALGAYLGSRFGRSMEREDQCKAAWVLEHSPDDRTTSWRNPNTGQFYSFTPTRTYDTDSGRCRDFKTATEMDGREEVVRGTACHQPGGTWKTS